MPHIYGNNRNEGAALRNNGRSGGVCAGLRRSRYKGEGNPVNIIHHSQTIRTLQDHPTFARDLGQLTLHLLPLTPASAKPAENMTRLLTPFEAHARADTITDAAGIARTAQSTLAGSSSMEPRASPALYRGSLRIDQVEFSRILCVLKIFEYRRAPSELSDVKAPLPTRSSSVARVSLNGRMCRPYVVQLGSRVILRDVSQRR